MNWQEVIADVLDILAEARMLPLFMGGGFFAIIKSLPDMIRVAREIWKLKIDVEHLYEVVQKIPVMAAAIRKAQDTGDTSDLEYLFGKPKPVPTQPVA